MANEVLIDRLEKVRVALGWALDEVTALDRVGQLDAFEAGYEQAWIEASMTAIEAMIQRNKLVGERNTRSHHDTYTR